jgi:diguanylate cyclase (GGDEF)-like protein
VTDTSIISQRRTVLITIILVILWNISGWYVAQRYYLTKARTLIEQETVLSQQRAGDIADSIARNLNNLHGIPNLFSGILRVEWALSRFGTSNTASTLPLEMRRKSWTADPRLNDLNHLLNNVQKNLNADLIYIVNAAGDCVAASNWDTPQTPIGLNFAERDFFKKNKMGLPGMQYAMGKATRIPGLFFSTPVIRDGQFIGAVVAKADVSNLSFLINQFDVFITDNYGIVILARNRSLEMHAMPDAAISALPEQRRLARYNRSSFPELKFEPWEDHRLSAVFKFENDKSPHIISTTPLKDYGLQVYVMSDMATLPVLTQNHFWFTLLLNTLGSMVILVIAGLIIHFIVSARSKTQLWKRANFDVLTLLPNRDMFRDRLSQEIKKSDRSSLPLALMLIDLDQFKEVNDTLGHDMGDILLQEAARRIQHCVRESDTVARLGGDEFTVVLSQLTSASHAEDIAQKIIMKLSEPFPLRDEVAHISASLGITLYPADATDIDSMMRNADQAMYVAKNQGRNRYSHFTASLQETAQKRLRLTNDLRSALSDQQFRLYFQPIVDLNTHRVHKAEALLRWQHPVRGMVSPAEFIPLAEETHLIVGIGVWIRREALIWCERWNTLNPDGFQISINKSPVEFMDDSDSDRVESFVKDLSERGLCGKNFVFEITEGLLLNADSRINTKLMALRDAGIQVSIDDFGTGYSSLSYLKKFDIDYLKIDQSFVRNLERDTNDMALCEAIIVMAHKLGLKVIAEGVETPAQRDFLSRAGCDYGQGYLFSRPLPPEEFEAWLKSDNET